MTTLNVIITGGFGALGSVVSQAFAKQGHKVCRVDVADTAPSDNPDGIDIGGLDLTRFEDCQRVIEECTQAFGGIDALINIAGGFSWETLEDGDLDTWHKMHSINLATALTMTKAALPILKQSQSGRIINMGAVGALSADIGLGAYAASKAGVHRMTEALAKELADTPINVNAIMPTIIDTPGNRAAMPDADTRDWVSPHSIADLILFLASPQSHCVTGALIPVSRGGIAG